MYTVLHRNTHGVDISFELQQRIAVVKGWVFSPPCVRQENSSRPQEWHHSVFRSSTCIQFSAVTHTASKAASSRNKEPSLLRSAQYSSLCVSSVGIDDAAADSLSEWHHSYFTAAYLIRRLVHIQDIGGDFELQQRFIVARDVRVRVALHFKWHR